MGTEQAYRLEWLRAPGVEGDAWRSVPRLICAACGRRYVAGVTGYTTPDDAVAEVDIGLYEPLTDSLMAVAGIVVCRRDLATLVRSAGLSGFEVRAATVRLVRGGQGEPIPIYDWLAVTARCEVGPMWTEPQGMCPTCHCIVERPITRPQRSVTLRRPLEASVCRAREAAAGILVDERFRNLCVEAEPDVARCVSFVPVPIDSFA